MEGNPNWKKGEDEESDVVSNKIYMIEMALLNTIYYLH